MTLFLRLLRTNEVQSLWPFGAKLLKGRPQIIISSLPEPADVVKVPE